MVKIYIILLKTLMERGGEATTTEIKENSNLTTPQIHTCLESLKKWRLVEVDKVTYRPKGGCNPLKIRINPIKSDMIKGLIIAKSNDP